MKMWNHRLLYNENKRDSSILGYEEPQILEVFKNTLPTKLYWILFPIEDLRQAVERGKLQRRLNQERITPD